MTADQVLVVPTVQRQRSSLGAIRVGLLGLIAAVALLAAGILGQALGAPARPAEGSADAGFARDMAAHHAQAVEMAEIVRGRTADTTIRAVATDVSLTQTSQIGIMQGWLGAWQLPVGSTQPRMAWMQGGMDGMHDAASMQPAGSGPLADGRMPGMASPADVARLRTLPRTEMDRLFLRLMISHHLAGVQMAEAGAQLASQSEVRALAENIVASQRAEVVQMRDMLTAMSRGRAVQK
jgi:uncharacterized protein (DUF305 family)